MPQLPSSKKSLRQSLKRRDRNRARKKAVKLTSRAVMDAMQAGETGDLQSAVSAAQKAVDKAARCGAIHRKKAARRKSRLAKRLNAASQATAAE